MTDNQFKMYFILQLITPWSLDKPKNDRIIIVMKDKVKSFARINIGNGEYKKSLGMNLKESLSRNELAIKSEFSLKKYITQNQFAKEWLVTVSGTIHYP